jgi:hypothetical protein
VVYDKRFPMPLQGPDKEWYIHTQTSILSCFCLRMVIPITIRQAYGCYAVLCLSITSAFTVLCPGCCSHLLQEYWCTG